MRKKPLRERTREERNLSRLEGEAEDKKVEGN